jgi:hypothetical protein
MKVCLRHAPLYIEDEDGASTPFDWARDVLPATSIPAPSPAATRFASLVNTPKPALRHVPLYIQDLDSGSYKEFQWKRLATYQPTPGALLPLWGEPGRSTPCSPAVWEADTVSWFFCGILTARTAAAWAAVSSVNTCVCMDVGNRAHVFTTTAAWDTFAATASAAAQTIFVHDLRATHCV